MNDKLQRVKTLLMTGRESPVKDEPLEDYLDVSNYGIILLSLVVENGENKMRTPKYYFLPRKSFAISFKPIMNEIQSEGYSVEIIDLDQIVLLNQYNVRSVPDHSSKKMELK